MNDVCPRFEQLSAYADGELDAAAARWLDEHVLHCGACRGTLRRLRSLHRAIEFPAARAPDLLPTIMERVECECHSGAEAAMGWSRWRPLPLALAASVVMWGGVLLGQALVAPSAAAPDLLEERMRLFDVAPPGAVYRISYLKGIEQ